MYVHESIFTQMAFAMHSSCLLSSASSLPFPLFLSSLSLSFLPFYSLPPPPSFCHAKEKVQAFVNVNVFLNILVTRLEDGSVAKSLPHIHDNLSSDPQQDMRNHV